MSFIPRHRENGQQGRRQFTGLMDRISFPLTLGRDRQGG